MRVSRSKSTSRDLAVAAIAIVVGAGLVIARPWQSRPACPPTAKTTPSGPWRDAGTRRSSAIRRALPAPTVRTRNLYHTSAAMWDAWAAYDKVASSVFVKEKLSASNVTAARNETMSYAAYRLLARYIRAVGGDRSLSEFADVMDSLCYPLDVRTTDGDSPAALGNRILTSASRRRA